MTATITAALLPNGEQQFSDANGAPYALGKVYFYVPTTLTFKDTWQDPTKSSLNLNPVDLDAAGRAIIYGAGQYRQILRDVNGNTVWDQLTNGNLGSSSGTWSNVSADPNPAVAGTNYVVDTSAGALNFTLPAAPANDDYLTITDAAGTFATNNLTVLRNGKNIMGSAANMTVATNNAYFGLVYQGATNGWRLTV